MAEAAAAVGGGGWWVVVVLSGWCWLVTEGIFLLVKQLKRLLVKHTVFINKILMKFSH